MILHPEELGFLSNHLNLVFTNGCFDILHLGHVRLIEYCSTLGEIVVALNSDASIKRLKGQNRPINALSNRLEIIQSLKWVSYVTFFEEDTPLGLIERICPRVLVKGGDYQEHEVVGSDFVKSYGGEVKIFPTLGTLSTTQILAKAQT